MVNPIRTLLPAVLLLPLATAEPPHATPADAGEAHRAGAASRNGEAQRSESLDDLIEAIRGRHEVPGIVAAVVRGRDVVAIGAAGVRQLGRGEPLTTGDRFHLGSCTKAMTATLVARLVERGELSWSATLAGALPTLTEDMLPAYHDVTVGDLLRHRAGLPDDRTPDWIHQRARSLAGPLPQQRRTLVQYTLAQPPAAPPGQQMIYSNRGYVVAAAVAEHATGRAWEDLMRDLLFAPLEMTTAGFGPPGSADTLDQPRGHMRIAGRLAPVQPGSPLADNPACTGPAGNVHCSIIDWARFVSLHLEAARGAPRLLSAESFSRLHADEPPQGYAMGWGVAVREGHVVRLAHAGRTPMWYSQMLLRPRENVAVLVAANCGADEAAQACAALLLKLADRFEIPAD